MEKQRKDGAVIACPNKECDYERPLPPEAAIRIVVRFKHVTIMEEIECRRKPVHLMLN